MDHRRRDDRCKPSDVCNLEIDFVPAVIARLDRQLPEVNFKGQGLSDVMDFLRDVSGAEIFVNWRLISF